MPGGLTTNAPRPRATQELALVKARGIERAHPKTLILGNSRSEIGLDPEAPQWPTAMRPVYNAAIPGTGPDAAVKYLQHAIAVGALRTVVVGLDFLDFLVDANGSMTSDGWELTPKPIEGPWRRVRDNVAMVLSLDTVEDSVLTLRELRDNNAADVTENGFNPLREYNLYARREGYGSLFLQRDTENARAYARLPKAVFLGVSETSPSWRALDRLLQLTRVYKIDVKFVIYPYHSHILEMFYGLGLDRAFDAWKVQLVRLIHSRDSNGGASCKLWDFSGYHAFAREQVPPLGDRNNVVKWYWESGHFKPALGNLMIDRMFHNGDPSLGVCLTSGNVADQVGRMDQDHQAYDATEPQVSAAISNLVQSAINAGGDVRARQNGLLRR